jgi:hypothetical protein
VAAALATHLLAYLVTGALGLYSFSTEGETLAGVYRQLRQRQEETNAS